MENFRLYIIRFFIIVSIGLGYNSCKVGPKFERPVVESPERYRNDSVAEADSILNLKWWELFNDPTLDSLIYIALENNKDVLIAASRIEQARAVLGVNRADFYPGLEVGAGIMSGNYAGGLFIFDETLDAFNATGQFSWELDFWGRIRRSTEAAKAEILASEFAMRTVQISLIADVATSYFLLLDFWSRYEISKSTFASRDSGHKIIEARFLGGIAPEIDVNQSQIQLAISQAAIPSYYRQINQAENKLSILLGQNPDSISFGKTLYEQDINPVIPAGIPSSVLNRRPDLLVAEAQLHAQTARIGIAQANRLPTISLTSVLGTVSKDLSAFNLGSTGWNISAGLFGPLFQWGKNKRKVDIEREKTEQVLLQYENSVLIAFSEVEIALRNISTYKDELEARKFQFEAATSAERLAFERYNGGITSYLEVLENQRSSFDAAILYSKTYQQYLNAHVGLYKALGGGWINEEEMKAEEKAQNVK